MLYPKINTLWKRDEYNKFKIIDGSMSCPEFDSIKEWHVTEKIDGTNIRAYFDLDKKTTSFKGRKEETIIPHFLEYALANQLHMHLYSSFLKSYKQVVLYGEGYGNKIQAAGKKYRTDVGFILFDALVDGKWLDREELEELASQLNIKIVPTLGIMTTNEIIDLVKSNFNSTISEVEQIAEGVVARSNPISLFSDGSPIMWKLKTRDYK